MTRLEDIAADPTYNRGYLDGYADAKADATKALKDLERECVVMLNALTLITRLVNETGHAVLREIRK